MTLVALRPLRIRRPSGDLHLKPGLPVDLPDGDAVRLLALKPNAVRPLLCPGDIVEWRSQALPKQRGEVLAVHTDGTFEVWHPLTEALCRLPVAWVLRVQRTAINPAANTSKPAQVATARIVALTLEGFINERG